MFIIIIIITSLTIIHHFCSNLMFIYYQTRIAGYSQ